MSDPEKNAAIPADASENVTAEPKAELPDSDLDKVAGGLGHAPLPQAQLNIGHSLTQEGRSLVSSVNTLIKP
jgi:hypothetical protein